MGVLGGGVSRADAPRFRRAAAIGASGLFLLTAALPPAASAADIVPRAAGADNAAQAAAPAAAADDSAAIRADISRTITSHEKDIRDDYHRELLKHPGIEGEIAVSFTVTPDGDVIDVKIDKSTLNWPPLETEILSRIGSWKFPPFKGKPIPATVPYMFRPGGSARPSPGRS